MLQYDLLDYQRLHKHHIFEPIIAPFSLGKFSKDMLNLNNAIGHANPYLYLEASQLSCSHLLLATAQHHWDHKVTHHRGICRHHADLFTSRLQWKGHSVVHFQQCVVLWRWKYFKFQQKDGTLQTGFQLLLGNNKSQDQQ